MSLFNEKWFKAAFSVLCVGVLLIGVGCTFNSGLISREDAEQLVGSSVRLQLNALGENLTAVQEFLTLHWNPTFYATSDVFDYSIVHPDGLDALSWYSLKKGSTGASVWNSLNATAVMAAAVGNLTARGNGWVCLNADIAWNASVTIPSGVMVVQYLNSTGITVLSSSGSTAIKNTGITTASLLVSTIDQQGTSGVKVSNLIVENGTSFPSSPKDNQVFYRTDSGYLYVYKAATFEWLPIGFTPNTYPYGNLTNVPVVLFANGSQALLADWNVGGAYGIYGATWVNATNYSGSGQFWWNGENRTDTLAYPIATYTNMVFKDGSFYKVKNGTSGAISYTSTDFGACVSYASQTDGVVSFPTGNFYVTQSSCATNKSVIYVGSGNGTKIYHAADVSPFMLTTGREAKVAIRDLSLISNRVYRGVAVNYTADIRSFEMSNVFVEAFQDGVLLLDRVVIGKVNNCVFHDNGNETNRVGAITIQSTTQYVPNDNWNTAFYVSETIFEPNFWADIEVKGEVDGLYVDRNWFETDNYGASFANILLSNASASQNHVHITNNRVAHYLNDHCSFFYSNGTLVKSSITDNEITASANAYENQTIYVKNAYNSDFSGNKIGGGSKNGAQNGLIYVEYAVSCTFNKNSLNTYTTGIHVKGGHSNTISDNPVTLLSTYATGIRATNVEYTNIEGNPIYSSTTNQTTGIYVLNSRGLVNNNIIYNCSAGIKMPAYSANIECAGNSFYSCTTKFSISYSSPSLFNNLGYNPLGLLTACVKNDMSWIVDSGGSTGWVSGTTYTVVNSPKSFYYNTTHITAVYRSGTALPLIGFVECQPGSTIKFEGNVTYPNILTYGN